MRISNGLGMAELTKAQLDKIVETLKKEGGRPCGIDKDGRPTYALPIGWLAPVPSLPGYALDPDGNLWRTKPSCRMKTIKGDWIERKLPVRMLSTTPNGKYWHVRKGGRSSMVAVRKVYEEVGITESREVPVE